MLQHVNVLVHVALAATLSVSAFAAASLAIGDGAGDGLGAFSATLARVASHELGLELELVPTAGSIETIERILRGELAMGLAHAADSHHAYRGLADFDVDEQPSQALRALGYVVTVRSHLVTRDDSAIFHLDDLVGARVAVGEPGSGTAAASQRLLRQAGLLERVSLVPVGGGEAERLLGIGRVDAYHALLATGAVGGAAAAGRRLVETGGAARASGLLERFPTYTEDIVTRGSHPAAASDVPSWSDAVLWVASDDLDEQVVYRMMMAAYGTADEPGPLRAAWATDGDGLRSVTLPLHRGAARFWLERGLEIPDAALPLEPR